MTTEWEGGAPRHGQEQQTGQQSTAAYAGEFNVPKLEVVLRGIERSG